MGMWMDQVASGWLLYDLTRSPLQLGLLQGLQAFPILFLSPIAGTAADRYDRKVQMMAALFIDVVLYTTLAVLIMTGQVLFKGLSVPVVSRLFRLGLFWHFLDIAWVGIFSVVYLPGLL